MILRPRRNICPTNLSDQKRHPLTHRHLPMAQEEAPTITFCTFTHCLHSPNCLSPDNQKIQSRPKLPLAGQRAQGPGPSKRAETEVPVYTQSPKDPNTEKRILKAVNEILLAIQASQTKVDDPTNPFNDPAADFIPEPTKPQIPFRQVDGDLLQGKKPGTRPGQPTYHPQLPLPDREPKGNTRPRPQK
jgi:hypothetical protein